MTTLSIENLSPTNANLTVSFQLSLSLLLCIFIDMSMNSMIASVIYSMDPFFLFFPTEVSKWDNYFPARLLPCPTTGVDSSATSSLLLGSTLTCTPCVKKAASNSRFSSLFRAGWVEEICRNPVAVPHWIAVLASHSDLALFYKTLCT